MHLVLQFNPYALISFIALLMAIGLSLYVRRQQYQTATLKWLSLTLLTLTIWAAAELMIRLSGDAQTAALFKYWEIAGYVFIGPTAVTLSLAYVGKEQLLAKSRWLLGLFAPAVLFVFAAWTQQAFVDFNQLSSWHQAWYGDWVAPLSPFFTYIFVPWLNLLLFFAIAQLGLYCWRSPRHRRRPTMILMVGVVVPTIIGLITDQLFETLTGRDMIELGTFTATISGAWLTYGILKFQLFEVNPGSIATNILSSMQDLVLVVNPAGDIDYVSPSVTSLLGFQPHQLTGQPIDKLISRPWGQIRQEFTQADESYSLELGLQSADGTLIPFGVKSSTFTGAGDRVLAYVLNGTDLRPLQELLHVTEERDKLQATLSSISDGVIGLDHHHRLLLVNRSFCQEFRLDANRIHNQPLDQVVGIKHAGQTTSISQLINAMHHQHQSQQRFDLNLKTGLVEIEAIATINLLPDPTSQLTTIVTIHNVSRQKELERMKTNFTNMAAHELRTPLTAIRGYIHLLQQQARLELTEEHRVLLDRASTSVDKLSDLANRLLEVSAAEHGQMTIQPELIPWATLFDQIKAEYLAKAKRDGWRLTIEPPPAATIKVDLNKFKQVLATIIENAVAYSDPPARVTIHSQTLDDHLLIHITDQGRGIEQGRLKQLFAPFSHADTGLVQTKQGIGLGLYLAQSIMMLHGGSIEVDSQPGQGSTFTLVLPLIEIDAS